MAQAARRTSRTPQQSDDTAQPAAQPVPLRVARPDIEVTRAAVAAGDPIVRALLVERHALIIAGKTRRLADVDAELTRHGYPTEPIEEGAVE